MKLNSYSRIKTSRIIRGVNPEAVLGYWPKPGIGSGVPDY
jgi:hypothetical protein